MCQAKPNAENPSRTQLLNKNIISTLKGALKERGATAKLFRHERVNAQFSFQGLIKIHSSVWDKSTRCIRNLPLWAEGEICFLTTAT